MYNNINNWTNFWQIGNNYYWPIPRSITPDIKQYIDSRLPEDKSVMISIIVNNDEESINFANIVGNYVVSLWYKCSGEACILMTNTDIKWMKIIGNKISIVRP